jgi:hypothetical protein
MQACKAGSLSEEDNNEEEECSQLNEVADNQMSEQPDAVHSIAIQTDEVLHFPISAENFPPGVGNENGALGGQNLVAAEQTPHLVNGANPMAQQMALGTFPFVDLAANNNRRANNEPLPPVNFPFGRPLPFMNPGMQNPGIQNGFGFEHLPILTQPPQRLVQPHFFPLPQGAVAFPATPNALIPVFIPNLNKNGNHNGSHQLMHTANNRDAYLTANNFGNGTARQFRPQQPVRNHVPPVNHFPVPSPAVQQDTITEKKDETTRSPEKDGHKDEGANKDSNVNPPNTGTRNNGAKRSDDRRFNSILPISLVATARSDDPGKRRLAGRTSLMMYLDCDEESLSDYQCFLRKQIELFEADNDDLHLNAQKMNKAIVLGQVGIRCRYCAMKPPWTRSKGAAYYSATLDGLYQACQNMSKNHLCTFCSSIPEAIKRELVHLKAGKRRAGGGKQYWAEAARAMGVCEDQYGLRFKVPTIVRGRRTEM